MVDPRSWWLKISKRSSAPSLGQWHIAELVDDEELDSGELGLKFGQAARPE